MSDENYPYKAYFKIGCILGDKAEIYFETFGVKLSNPWIFVSKVEVFIKTIEGLENLTSDSTLIQPGFIRWSLRYREVTDFSSWVSNYYHERIVTLLNNKWKSEWGLRSPASLKISILKNLRKDKRFLAKSIVAYSYTHYMDETNLLLEHFDKEIFDKE